MSAALSINGSNFTADVSHYRYLPTKKRTLRVERYGFDAYDCGSDVLQAIVHVVRCNPVDPKFRLARKLITFRGKQYNVIWDDSPDIEFYDMSTGQGYQMTMKYDQELKKWYAELI